MSEFSNKIEKISSNSPIKISVIIPVYNVSGYLQEALESVTGQSLKEIEIIAIDDGSTDDSSVILDDYAQKDFRIKVVHKANTGYGHTMNLGLELARGEYIAVLEPDDYMKPDMLKALYTVADTMKAEIVKSDYSRFYTDAEGLNIEEIHKIAAAGNYYRVFHPNQADEGIRVSPFVTWCGIIKREFLEKWHIRHNETPGASYQDNAFNFQLLMYADSLVLADYPGYCYRIDNPNSSVKQTNKMYAMNEEYAFLYGIIISNPKLHIFLKYYWFRKYINAIFVLKRIPDIYKDDYVNHMREEFLMARNKGELVKECFAAKRWEEVSLLLNDIKAYKDKYIS